MIIPAVIGKTKVTTGSAELDIKLTYLCGKFIGAAKGAAALSAPEHKFRKS